MARRFDNILTKDDLDKILRAGKITGAVPFGNHVLFG